MALAASTCDLVEKYQQTNKIDHILKPKNIFIYIHAYIRFLHSFVYIERERESRHR